MSRKFIASIMAASIAITGISAVPAQADSNDLARFLAGATALVIIGRALDDNHSSSRSVTHYHHYDDNHNTYRNPSRGNHYGTRNTNVDRPKRLPPGCLTRVRTQNGSRQVFGEACLNEHYSHTAALPRECRTRSTSNGTRRGYEATCLFNRGYKAATR